MAFIRFFLLATACLLCNVNMHAQTVWYPQASSQLLKATAEDVASLLQKSIGTGNIQAAAYAAVPSTGIIFRYDSTITDNQACRVQCSGSGVISFSAAEDNGLAAGVYRYLQNIGFRFYQPGELWQVIPVLTSPYKKFDTLFSSNFKYKTWTISGGHNRWIMDNNTAYGWDTYFGENGHNWALYQRRNVMTGAFRFQGHRGDIINGEYLTTLQNNPCYVACNNNSRAAGIQSVPDINNENAKQLWATTIEQKFSQYRNTIFSNKTLYANQYRNFTYNNGLIGIEVPDAAKWGNSADNTGCVNTGYPKESDQQFTLAGFTAQKIAGSHSNMRYQLYAYGAHADIPSASIALNSNLDVQLVPAVYQNITSTNGLRKRWYGRTKNLSEYHYLNLSGWSGETPSFSLEEMKNTVETVKLQKGQGLVFEASPAKFASLPYLLAANRTLLEGDDMNDVLMQFCNDMFAGANKTVYELLQLWTNNDVVAGGTSNKYKLPLYLQMLQKADMLTQNASPQVKQRLAELKAYLHYMVLYFDWASDLRSEEAKKEKAAKLCLYLAATNKMQLVNSYYMIAVITSKYGSTSTFYKEYNNANGSAYQNGNLSLITNTEIENNFKADFASYSAIIGNYNFIEAGYVTNQFTKASVSPADKISFQLGYTNGLDYYNRMEYYFIAPAAGSFTLNYKPSFDMSGKGYINFTVEEVNKVLSVQQDFTLDQTAKDGSLTIQIPVAGTYKLTISTKYKSKLQLEILCNKNVFYKKGSFLGNATETFTDIDYAGPQYIYVPAGLTRVYFSLQNSGAGGAAFATADKVNKAFAFLDQQGNTLSARIQSSLDSALFFIDLPLSASGKFIRVSKMGNYSLVFSNISNLFWFAKPSAQQGPAASNNSGTAVGENLKVFPNPSTGVFNILPVNGHRILADEIKVTSAGGQSVANINKAAQIDISHAAKGIYFYQVRISDKVFTGKLVKL